MFTKLVLATYGQEVLCSYHRDFCIDFISFIAATTKCFVTFFLVPIPIPICSLCSVAQVQFVCIFKTNTKFPDRGEMSFPLFKLYACNNVTKYVLFLFDLAKCIFYGTVLLYILFIKRKI